MKCKAVFFLYFFCLTSAAKVIAQSLSVSAGGGLMKYQGDLDISAYSMQGAKPCFTAGIQYQLGHFILRGDYIQGSVTGSDSDTKKRKSRNLSFSSDISEYSLGLEYDLFDITADKKFTPYIFGALGVYHFNPYAFDLTGKKVYLQPLGTEGQGLSMYPDRKPYKLTQLNNILGGGLKYKLTNHFTLAGEIVARKLSTDYLDDVSTKYPNEQALFAARGQQAVDFSFRADEVNPRAVFTEGKKRGNPGSKDTYYHAAIKLTYTFSIGSGSGHFRSGKGWGSTKCPPKVQ